MKYKKLLDAQLANICRDCFEEIDVLQVWEDATYDETKFAAACVLMACADDAISPTVFEGMKQEAAEDMYDEGPRAFGVVGGDVMEFGPQVGGDILF